MGNDDRTLPHTDRMPRADDFPWTKGPVDRLENVSAEDLLALEPGELLAYVADCRDDLRAVRETLHAALALVARQHDQLVRAARVVEFQRREIRGLREDIAA